MTDQFVWKLKGEKPSDKSEDSQKRKQEEILSEIEKVKKRRRERELEKQEWEDQKNRMQREKDSNNSLEWEEKDNQFFLKQAKLASEIRIKEGRAKPIDVLYKMLHRGGEKDNFQTKLEAPHNIFKGMKVEQLEELVKDIDTYQKLEGEEHADYWDSLVILCDEKIKRMKNISSSTSEGVQEEVEEEIKSLFKGKDLDELNELEKEIEASMKDESSSMVPEYWDSLLKRIVLYKAKARLRKIFQSSLSHQQNNNNKNHNQNQKPPKKFELETVYEDDEPSYKPTNTVDARKAALEKEAERLRAKAVAKAEEKPISEEEMYSREEAIMMEENEEGFKDEVALNKTYNWSDKHAPRKPKYFNRVHTGFEWNKYNQTHYDQDNPPPKIVQGYKFNIFYPNLIDPSKTPRYFIEKSDNPDYVIIRFHAGPPYEDIAFSIVNKDWEQSYKKGFKNNFERGILHLWFNFKRYRYRR